MAKAKHPTPRKPKGLPVTKANQKKARGQAGANGEGPPTTHSKIRERLIEKEKKGPGERAKLKVAKGTQDVSDWPEETKAAAKKTAAEIEKQEGKDKKKAKTKKEKEGKFDRTYGEKFEEVLYPEISLMLYRQFPKGVDKENAEELGESGILDAMQAAELLGWQEEDKELGRVYGSQFKFKDLEGNKIRMLRNPTNRPFRKGLAMRYANEILRGEWQLNGESIILDKYGRVQSGQHRLAGVIFANQMLKGDIEKWSDYSSPSGGTWKEGGVFIETVVVVGIDPNPKVVDTIDLAQKRSLGDVLFRNDEFQGKENVMAKMSNILSHSIRLAWLRSGGAKVSDAPHFPLSEALNFLQDHPRLKDCVKFIADAEGSGKEGKKISQFVSLGYAAGTMYLMMTSGTDREAYDDGSEELDFKMEDKAKDFCQMFAGAGKDFPTGHPIKELRKRLSEISAGDGAGRDEIIGTIAKAFNIWVDGKKTTALKLKRIVDEETDVTTITEDPRMGGLDMELGD